MIPHKKQKMYLDAKVFSWIKYFQIYFNAVTYYYPPSSEIASCVGTVGTVTCRLHLT